MYLAILSYCSLEGLIPLGGVRLDWGEYSALLLFPYTRTQVSLINNPAKHLYCIFSDKTQRGINFSLSSKAAVNDKLFTPLPFSEILSSGTVLRKQLYSTKKNNFVLKTNPVNTFILTLLNS